MNMQGEPKEGNRQSDDDGVKKKFCAHLPLTHLISSLDELINVKALYAMYLHKKNRSYVYIEERGILLT